MKSGVNESRDLGVTLVAAAALLLVVGYLTQCSSAPRRTESALEAGSAPTSVVSPPEREEHRSAHGPGDEQEDEERAKIRNVAHALQTIAGNPEMRATLGLPK